MVNNQFLTSCGFFFLLGGGIGILDGWWWEDSDDWNCEIIDCDLIVLLVIGDDEANRDSEWKLTLTEDNEGDGDGDGDELWKGRVKGDIIWLDPFDCWNFKENH